MIAKTRRNKRDTFQNIFFAIFLGVLAVVFIAFFVISDFRISQKRRDFQAQIANLQKEIQLAEEKKARLEEGISQTEKDTYWEEKIREQGFKKPGEEQVVVLSPEEAKNEQTKNLSLQRNANFYKPNAGPCRHKI